MSAALPDPLPLSDCIGEVARELFTLTRVDGCPACLNTEPANSWIQLENGFRTSHRCADCGMTWTTDWKD